MKTLKKFAIVCIMLGFRTIAVNAQTTQAKEIDMPWSVNIPCVPENAVGVITLHSTFHYDKHGILTKWHCNVLAGELVGDVTGTIYSPEGKTQEQTKSGLSNGAMTDTYTNTYMFIGKNGVTFKVQEVMHITTTPAGEVTATVDQATVTCK